MKPSTSLLLFFVLAVWICILGFGFIKGLSTILKPRPQPRVHDSQMLMQQQRERAQEVADQQKRASEDNAHRLWDLKFGKTEDQKQQIEDHRKTQAQLTDREKLAEQQRRLREEQEQRLQDIRYRMEELRH